MTAWDLFRRGWDWHPSVIAGCFVLLAGYLTAVHGRVDRSTLLFAAGVLVMLVALVSPLDPLGDDYLFSAHMAQHILLDLVAPALFVLGFPPRLAPRLFAARPIAFVERVLRQPLLSWILGAGTLCIWHLPGLYNATLASENVHIFEHLTFLVTGTIFWWPALAPLPAHRLPPFAAVGYLALAAMANGALGIVLTLSTTPYYPGYANPRDELGALGLIRQQWGISQLIDQQVGGALMWVVGSFIFLGAIAIALARWVRAEAEVIRS